MTASSHDPSARALSFGAVADAYDRARPSYPRDAVRWLTGASPRRVLELGAGTGKLTEELARLGHRVMATDPLAPMLARLAGRVPGTPIAQGTAEQIPVRSRSVDTVVAGQSFHWFDLARALPEIARVLRPGGEIALVWNLRDETVPWVRRLGRLLGTPEQATDPTHPLLSSNLFGYVDSATFRFWQPLDRDRLRDLLTSRSNVAVMTAAEREDLLARADELYDGYGRGADGMLLPYVTHCYKAVVRAPANDDPGDPGDPGNPGDPGGSGPVASDGTDPDALLIDFS